jgi:hypothetical protein
VLLHDGHWQKSELQSITMKSVKPFIKVGVLPKLFNVILSGYHAPYL